MKSNIGLVTVLTDNIQSLKSFYSDVLGFSIQIDLGNYVEFGNEGVRFAICQKEVMKKATNHLSYQEQRRGQSFELAFPAGSPEDVDRTYNEIVAKGATPIKEPEMMRGEEKLLFSQTQMAIYTRYIPSNPKISHNDDFPNEPS